MNFILLTISFSLLFLSAKAKLNRPASLPLCYRNDPNINKCILDATEQIRPQLIKGIPELKLPTLEPFKVPEIKLEQGGNAVNLKAVLQNVLIHGMTNYKFDRFDFDVSKLEFAIDCVLTNITFKSDYKASGKILIVPIEGKGNFLAEIGSMHISANQKYKEVKFADGKIHIIPDSTKFNITATKPKARLDGLFDGNKEMTETTNKIINENIDELFEAVKPMIEETVIRIVNDVLLKSILENVAYEDLYPINPDLKN